MENLASFCFKFKVTQKRQSIKCRILIELVKRTPTTYQVITYIYKGINIIDKLGSDESCLSYCNDIFFKSIQEKNIQSIIMYTYQIINKYD